MASFSISGEKLAPGTSRKSTRFKSWPKVSGMAGSPEKPSVEASAAENTSSGAVASAVT